MATASPFEVPQTSALPDGLTLDEIFATLSAAGHSVSFDRQVRAFQLFAQMGQSGTKLSETEAANWCVSLLCSTREEQDLVRSVVLRRPQKIETSEPAMADRIPLMDKQRLLYGAIFIALIIAAYGAFFTDLKELASQLGTMIGSFSTPSDPSDLPDAIGPGGVAGLVPLNEAVQFMQGGQEDSVVLDEAIRFLFDDVLVPLYALFPWMIVAWFVLQGRGAQQAALIRRKGKGRKFTELAVPLRHMARGPSDFIRRATERFKMQRLEQGTRLDVKRSLTSILAKPGTADVFFKLEKRNIDYLMLFEGRASDGVRQLLYDRVRQRFEQSDTPFAQYELGAAINTVAFRHGRRDGLMSEQLDDVLNRYRGGRIILCGTGSELVRRDSRQKGDARLSALVRDFDVVLAFIPTPKARWGASERELTKRGVVLFECSDAGYIAAGAYLVSGAGAQGAKLHGRDDPYLTYLSVNMRKFQSDVAPDAREIATLVRQTRGYLASRSAWRLFAAHCAVPQFDRAMTLFLAERVTGQALDDDTGLRLSALPWFVDNRIPDWMRLAVLQSLDNTEQYELSRKLQALYLELLGDIQGPISDSATDVLIEAGVTNTLIDRLGLGASVIDGEGVFLRFLNGEISGDLEQDVGDVSPDPSARRLILAAGIMVAGLIAAPFLTDQAFRVAPQIMPVSFNITVMASFTPVAIYVVLLCFVLGQAKAGRLTWGVLHVLGIFTFLVAAFALVQYPTMVRRGDLPGPFGTTMHLQVWLGGIMFLAMSGIHAWASVRETPVISTRDVPRGPLAPLWGIYLTFCVLSYAFGVLLVYFASRDAVQVSYVMVVLSMLVLAVLFQVLRTRGSLKNDNGARELRELACLFVLHFVMIGVGMAALTGIVIETLIDSPHIGHVMAMGVISACLSYGLLHNRAAVIPTLVMLVTFIGWSSLFAAEGEPLFDWFSRNQDETFVFEGDVSLWYVATMLLGASVIFWIGDSFLRGFLGGQPAIERQKGVLRTRVDKLMRRREADATSTQAPDARFSRFKDEPGVKFSAAEPEPVKRRPASTAKRPRGKS